MPTYLMDIIYEGVHHAHIIKDGFLIKYQVKP